MHALHVLSYHLITVPWAGYTMGGDQYNNGCVADPDPVPGLDKGSRSKFDFV